MMQDGIYVSGELWEYWRDTFPRPSVCDVLTSWCVILMMNVWNLLGHWPSEGLSLSFMLICLTGLHALVVVAWRALTPFVLCSVIAFWLLYYCASNALLL